MRCNSHLLRLYLYQVNVFLTYALEVIQYLERNMRILFIAIAVLITSSCQSHPKHHKVILVDNHHKNNHYTIVKVKPKKHRVCKKHKKHWHCTKV